MAERTDPLQRWWSKVDRRGPDECWLWLASCTPNGYGRFTTSDGVTRPAHRAGWQLLNGQTLPTHLFVCHTCDNRVCCNPAHWFIGTNSDNVADRVAKGRSSGRPPRGEASPRAKVTSAQVRDIRRRYAAGGISQSALGEEYGVDQTHVSRIIRGTRWAEGAGVEPARAVDPASG